MVVNNLGRCHALTYVCDALFHVELRTCLPPGQTPCLHACLPACTLACFFTCVPALLRKLGENKHPHRGHYFDVGAYAIHVGEGLGVCMYRERLF